MEKLLVMDKVLTIQQMAQATGLSAHTLRYYERAGLMRQHVGRDDGNGYRTYTEQHITWVMFIKRLRSTGMPIRDIQRYTELLRQGEHTIPARMQLLKQHRNRVEARLLEEQQHLSAINTKIAYYEQCQQQTAICGEDVTPLSNECMQNIT
jgi:DNA-binding transcriptional MerR regulator